MESRTRFRELDHQSTPLGDLTLRWRVMPELGDREVIEVVLGDAFLMSSLFTRVEEELARLGLAAARRIFSEGGLDVVVGGLGLGYTARAALEAEDLRSLRVVEFLAPVIGWHEGGLVPLGAELCADSRCEFVHGDFFEMALGDGFDRGDAGRRFHAVLLDIDHSPGKLLHESNRAFYQVDGLRKAASRLHPGGVFGLWSDDPPEEDFLAALGEVFERVEAHEVRFENPHQGGEAASTIYVARR